MVFPYRTKLKAYFITGLLVVAPLMVVFFVTALIIKTFGRMVSYIPLLSSALEKYKFVGMEIVIFVIGVCLSLGVILLVGVFTANIFGKRAVGWMETTVLSRIPLMNRIYLAVKQLMELLFIKRKKIFSGVVLVEYPRKGIYALGFVTANSNSKFSAATGKRLLHLYVPTALNIASGFLVITPEDEVIPLDITVEEGFKLVISGGVLTEVKEKELYV